jgi:hypothetical protein
MKGTIDFSYDAQNDIVLQRPRWRLDMPVEVMRWYQLQAGYLSARFRQRKDIIEVDTDFDVIPKVTSLWGQYRARLHELYVRYSVRVGSGAHVRLAANTSTVLHSLPSVERSTVEEAVAYILQMRRAGDSGSGTSGTRGRISKVSRLSGVGEAPKASSIS